MKWKWAIPMVSLFLLWACGGKGVGETCTWKGSGFTATHDCGVGSFCLSTVACKKSGTTVPWSRCTGSVCSSDTDCPQDMTCTRYSDTRSYCIPRSVCQ